MPASQRKTRYRRVLGWALVMAFVVAGVLRFVGLGFGRGVLCSRADEELLRSGVLIALTGDLNPHYAVWGHLFHYVYAAVAAVWLALQVWTGEFSTWTDAVAAAHCEPWTLIRIGRAISATAGVLTLVATYQLARRCFGSRLVAVCACVLLSTLFLHVRDSHFATSDVLLALFCTAALAAMTTRGQPDAGWAGLWTGLALAAKLLSATVVLTFLCAAILIPRRGGSDTTFGRRVRDIVKYLAVAAAVALVTQPFLVLDPMETWFGLFGDLFNPERLPFEHGLSLTNAKIIVRYYVPQAMGWTVGGLALLGGLLSLRRGRSPRVLPLLLFAFWSLAAVLSVQRIFLRYLDPLLPVTCVLAAWAIDRAARLVKRQRLAVTLAITAAAAAPNLFRDFWLDRHLLQDDTRALAGRWIEQNVPAGSRIVWSGYGSIESHLTMPWLHTPEAHDRSHIAERLKRRLSTTVDEAIIDWKAVRKVPAYVTVGLGFGADGPEQDSFVRYEFLDHHYDLPFWFKHVDTWARTEGIVTAESPRWDMMRRHVVRVWRASPESILESGEEYVIITGMPCDPVVIETLRQAYNEVRVFDPGVPWAEFGKSVMYDSGDAWYVPNCRIERVDRPGPEVRIFQKR